MWLVQEHPVKEMLAEQLLELEKVLAAVAVAHQHQEALAVHRLVLVALEEQVPHLLSLVQVLPILVVVAVLVLTVLALEVLEVAERVVQAVLLEQRVLQTLAVVVVVETQGLLAAQA
jgi:hypothetical protein